MVTAKLIAMLVAGAVLGLLATAVTLVVAWPWLAAKDMSVSLFSSDVGLVMLAVIAVSALFGVSGVGVGALIRNHTNAPTTAATLAFAFAGAQLLVRRDVT